MGEERIHIGDILTPQEHYWMGSTSIHPDKEEQWYIPVGVLLRRITDIEQAKLEREKMGYVNVMYLPSLLGISENVAMTLEEIDAITGQTTEDPRTLLVNIDSETKKIVPILDDAGNACDLTAKVIQKFREKGLEEELNLRPRAKIEGQNPSLGEGNKALL